MIKKKKIKPLKNNEYYFKVHCHVVGPRAFKKSKFKFSQSDFKVNKI